MLSADRIRRTIEGQGMSEDSIRSIAYRLAGRVAGRSDSTATLIGQRLRAGQVLQDELEFLMSSTSEINISVDEDVDSFCDGE